MGMAGFPKKEAETDFFWRLRRLVVTPLFTH